MKYEWIHKAFDWFIASVVLVLITIAYGGCGPKTFVGDISVQPAPKVEVGGKLSVSISIDNPPKRLKLVWKAKKGKAPNENQLSGEYIAPDEPGTDTITCEVWSGSKLLVPPKTATVEVLPIAPLKPGDINDIVELIKQSQRENVRESYGEWAGQCFTDEDYQAFTMYNRPQKIASALKGNRKFMEAVLALKAMPEEERNQFVSGCRRPLRPTWAQLGRISPEGQTVAGQRAEIDIANAVADTVLELLKLSYEEIFTVFKKHRIF